MDTGFWGRRIAQKEIQLLRLVSKVSRDSVDCWIEENICEEIRDMDWGSLQRYKFSVSSDIEHLNKALVFSRGPIEERPKRFVLKALEIELTSYVWPRRRIVQPEDMVPPPEDEKREILRRSFQLLRDNIIELLGVIGSQILFFELHCKYMKEMEDLGLGIAEIYSFLQDCLLLMPNLKWIVLKASGLKSLLKQPTWKASATSALQNRPIPRLPLLERVDLSVESIVGNAAQAFPIWDWILTPNPQVKYHTYYGHFYNYERHTEPSVQSLELEVTNLGTRSRMWDMPLLRQILDCKWNLKRLKMMINIKFEEDGMNIIFRFLEKFQALEDLSLAINNIKFVEDGCLLRLPKLRKLRLDIGPAIKIEGDRNPFFSLQFIFHCAKLESLVWNNFTFSPIDNKLRHQMEQLKDDQGKTINFGGGFPNLKDSNVWGVFPKLKCMIVKFRQKNEKGEGRYYMRKYFNRKLKRWSNKEWEIPHRF